VLTVAVASDAVKQELHYVSPQVMEGINVLLGYPAVGKVRAITRHELGSRNKTAGSKKVETLGVAIDDTVKELCKSVKNEELRTALMRLGAQVTNKNGGKKS
jgi:hypothetical protein